MALKLRLRPTTSHWLQRGQLRWEEVNCIAGICKYRTKTRVTRRGHSFLAAGKADQVVHTLLLQQAKPLSVVGRRDVDKSPQASRIPKWIQNYAAPTVGNGSVIRDVLVKPTHGTVAGRHNARQCRSALTLWQGPVSRQVGWGDWTEGQNQAKTVDSRQHNQPAENAPQPGIQMAQQPAHRNAADCKWQKNVTRVPIGGRDEENAASQTGQGKRQPAAGAHALNNHH